MGWLEVRRTYGSNLEKRFGVNHVGHFYLVQLVRPLLTGNATTSKSRVVTVILRRFLGHGGRSGVISGRSVVVPGSFGVRFGVDGGRSGLFQGHSGVVRRSFGSHSGFVRKFFEKFSNKNSKKFRNLFC